MSDVQKDLVSWLHSQEEWLQEAAERLANTGAPLTEADIADVTALLKTPNGRKKTSHRTYPQLVHGAAPGSKVRLVSIGPVEGIDRLAPRTPLSFGEKPLCVIYGHNGSGKSGYTRVLARASGKPRAPELRHNAYASAPAAQKCTITYSIDGAAKSVEWDPASGPIEDLRCVDVFDTDTAAHYLSEETTASYSPPAVTLLERLAKTCDRVNARLQAEQEAYRSTLPRIPSQFKDTDVACVYGGLTPDTSLVEVQRLTTWTEEDEGLLAAVESALKTIDPETQAKATLESERFTRKLLADLQAIATALGSDALVVIREARAAARATRNIAIEASAAATATAKIDGVGSDTWKALWRAAREFSLTNYPTAPFPPTEAGARCVLCQQDIAADAVGRLAAFEAFIQGQVSREADSAEQAYRRALNELPLLPTDQAIAERCHAAQLPDNWPHKLRPFLEAAAETIERLRRDEDNTAAMSPVLDAALAASLTTHAKSLADSADALTAVSKNEARATKEREWAELAARKWTAERQSDVTQHLAKKKAFAEFETLRTATSSRAASNKARALADNLINEAYVTRFNSELSALGAQRIRVELVPTRVEKGTSFVQLRLKDSTTASGGPDAVLSEGERRVVALAAFLADVTAGPTDTPFVFDDPITSLDQDFETLAIKRLHELSLSRQVIILTHRLGFVGTIVDLGRDQITATEIRGRDRSTGRPALVTTYGLKPLAALKTLKQDHLSRASKTFTEDEDSYRSIAKELCSDIRVHLERVVETYILCGVVERHRRSVETTRMKYFDRVTLNDREIIGRFMTKYSCFEHSQPSESPIAIPTPDEIEADLNQLISWLEPFVPRLNK